MVSPLSAFFSVEYLSLSNIETLFSCSSDLKIMLQESIACVITLFLYTSISILSTFHAKSRLTLKGDQGQTMLKELKEDQGQTMLKEDQGQTVLKELKEDQGQTVLKELKEDQGQTLLKEDQGQTLLKEDQGQTLVKEDQGQTLLKEDQGQTLLKEDQGQTMLNEPGTWKLERQHFWQQAEHTNVSFWPIEDFKKIK